MLILRETDPIAYPFTFPIINLQKIFFGNTESKV